MHLEERQWVKSVADIRCDMEVALLCQRPITEQWVSAIDIRFTA